MQIPDEFLTEKFRKKLRRWAGWLVEANFMSFQEVFDYVGDKEAFKEDLLAKLDETILRMPDDGRRYYAPALCTRVMRSIIKDTIRAGRRRLLAASVAIGTNQGTRTTAKLPDEEFVRGELEWFCENVVAACAKGHGMTDFKFHLLQRRQLGMDYDDYCAAYPGAPRSSTFWRWEQEFTKHALRRWQEIQGRRSLHNDK
jgi:hypothetical protein